MNFIICQECGDIINIGDTVGIRDLGHFGEGYYCKACKSNTKKLTNEITQEFWVTLDWSNYTDQLMDSLVSKLWEDFVKATNGEANILSKEAFLKLIEKELSVFGIKLQEIDYHARETIEDFASFFIEDSVKV